jgi:hypothetical protein
MEMSVSLEQQEQQVATDRPAHPVLLVQLESKALLALLARLDPLALKDLLVLLDTMAQLVPPVNWVPLVPLVQRVLLEVLALQELQVLRETQVIMETAVPPGLWVRLVSQVLKDTMEQRVKLVQMGLQD